MACLSILKAHLRSTTRPSVRLTTTWASFKCSSSSEGSIGWWYAKLWRLQRSKSLRWANKFYTWPRWIARRFRVFTFLRSLSRHKPKAFSFLKLSFSPSFINQFFCFQGQLYHFLIILVARNWHFFSNLEIQTFLKLWTKIIIWTSHLEYELYQFSQPSFILSHRFSSLLKSKKLLSFLVSMETSIMLVIKLSYE